MTVTGKILENITLWRKGEKKEVKIRGGDQNKIGWENFLHGRMQRKCVRSYCTRDQPTTTPKIEKVGARAGAGGIFRHGGDVEGARCHLASAHERLGSLSAKNDAAGKRCYYFASNQKVPHSLPSASYSGTNHEQTGCSNRQLDIYK